MAPFLNNGIRRLLFLVAFASACAHNGPPFPIISDYRMGSCIISLWTHPDVGIGTFFVVVNPAPGKQIPKDLRFDIGVLPVSGRLKEARYNTTRGTKTISFASMRRSRSTSRKFGASTST